MKKLLRLLCISTFLAMPLFAQKDRTLTQEELNAEVKITPEDVFAILDDPYEDTEEITLNDDNNEKEEEKETDQETVG